MGIRDNNLEINKHAQVNVLPVITLTNSEGKYACESSESATDGMLNSISNDLDYLLNRTQEVPTVSTSSDSHHQPHQQQQLPTVIPPPPVAFSNQTSKSMLLQHDVIMEESEHEVDS